MNYKNGIKFCFLLFLTTFKFVIAQESKFDSLLAIKKTDSLKSEIRKNFHNYDAIREYYFLKDDPIFSQIEIPKFYDSLFTLIENDNRIQPEYYLIRANIFYSVGDERAKIFKKGFIRFPKNNQINDELGSFYHNKFIESNNKITKAKYADSARIHLEIYDIENSYRIQKIKNIIELYQIYYFQNEKSKIEKIENEILNISIHGIYLKTFLSINDLKTDNKANFKVISFLNDLEYLNESKQKFGIKNTSNIYFNFFLSRSSFKPILISVEEKKGKYFISYAVSKNADTIIKPFETKIKEITTKKFQNFLNLLKMENLEKSSTTNPGYDGSYWYLESKLNDLHVINGIWSPQISCNSKDSECSAIKACLYLIKLSGLKTSLRNIDSSDYKYDPDETDGYKIW